jgi:hypothetical protein
MTTPVIILKRQRYNKLCTLMMRLESDRGTSCGVITELVEKEHYTLNNILRLI